METELTKGNRYSQRTSTTATINRHRLALLHLMQLSLYGEPTNALRADTMVSSEHDISNSRLLPSRT